MPKTLPTLTLFCCLFAFANVFVVAQVPVGGQPESQNSSAETSDQESDATPLKPVELGSTKNVTRVGNLYLAGQFTPEDIEQLKQAGIERVITLRTDGEISFDEQKLLEEAGIEYQAVPFRKPESLTDEVFDQTRKLLADDDSITMLHCGSANRVGGVWLAHRVLDENVPLSQAREEAKQVGLRTEEYETRALEYIRKKQAEAEQSVRPGINESYLKADLDPKDFVNRFEIESREVYSARNEVLRACQVRPGMFIADIGSGTGLYTRLFSNQTGPDGWVYAVDISPGLLQHAMAESKQREQTNVTGVLCREDSISLPPESIDLAFVCDTYHHFEYPQSTLASIHRALKPGGRLVVIDFYRIEGKSRPFIMDHVRAGKEVFTQEIIDAGFDEPKDIEVPGLEENYFLMFTKNIQSTEQ